MLHGHGGSDKDYFWFEDTKKFLESKNYSVWWPLLPHTEAPQLEETSNFVLKNMPEISEETIVIGHSSGCPLVLHLLEFFETPVMQVILVAGYYEAQSDSQSSMLPEKFDWDLIKTKASEFVLINSDNDPWGCTDKQARPIVEKLGAQFIFAKGEGHMGSGTYNQPYREFKLLKDLIK
ncbi:MAG: putative Alpha/beta fold family hydrolase [Candidatus Saccharibacteria bacterium]|nr:putative Alpha/beta fold family hydrolase [Candidatus Saccharibacteria bacterium]